MNLKQLISFFTYGGIIVTTKIWVPGSNTLPWLTDYKKTMVKCSNTCDVSLSAHQKGAPCAPTGPRVCKIYDKLSLEYAWPLSVPFSCNMPSLLPCGFNINYSKALKIKNSEAWSSHSAANRRVHTATKELHDRKMFCWQQTPKARESFGYFYETRLSLTMSCMCLRQVVLLIPPPLILPATYHLRVSALLWPVSLRSGFQFISLCWQCWQPENLCVNHKKERGRRMTEN